MPVFLLSVLLSALLTTAAAAQPAAPASHPAMRPLPKPSTRPLAKGPARFVDAVHGDDAHPGTEAAPWKTIRHALPRLKAGDTLYLRAACYRECLTCTQSGTQEAPLTLRSYPGELAILDGGFAEFAESPERAWEPFAGGACGEYRSTKSYPSLATEDEPRRKVYVLGNFGDSMIPLHGYHTLLDLRSQNEYWNLDAKSSKQTGLYCGPGLWYDTASQRIHIRLAQTTLPGLGHDNYRGETDPRRLRLVIAGPDPVLRIEAAKHLRVQDLLCRGTRSSTVSISGAEDIELDGVTLYGGAPALKIKSTTGLRVVNSALRGVSAPWSFRTSEKYRGVSTYLLTTDEKPPQNRDLELAYCELTDCHDGLYLHGAESVKLHHCLVDNFNDDGIEVGPKRQQGQMLVYQNLISRCLLTFSLHGGQKPGPIVAAEPGSGVYIFRNLIDLRPPAHYHQPESRDAPQEITTCGWACSDHGSPTWPVYRVYHNVFLCRERVYRNFYGAGFGGHMRGTQRWVFNNVFLYTHDLPGLAFESGQAELQADGNLHWSTAAGPDYPGELVEKFRQSKAVAQSKDRYAPGWGAHDRFADPAFFAFHAAWRQPADLRLRPTSPAVDAGVTIPHQWPDPLREPDAGRPDIGALPLGCTPWTVGVNGRLSICGPAQRQ
jgi:hypothetical protein